MQKIPYGLKKVATLIILKNKNQLLLLKRAKAPHIGKYVPVGGKLAPHESPYQAALRETLEETGIAIEKAKFCGILTETSPVKYNWINYVYLAEIPYQPAPFCNEGILEWIDIDNLLSLPTPPTDWWIYEYILANKPFVFSAEFDAALNMLEMREDIEGVYV